MSCYMTCVGIFFIRFCILNAFYLLSIFFFSENFDFLYESFYDVNLTISNDMVYFLFDSAYFCLL